MNDTTLPHDARAEQFLTVAEIAKRLRVSPMTVYRLVHDKAFPGAIRVGRTYRVPASSVDAYLKASVIP